MKAPFFALLAGALIVQIAAVDALAEGRPARVTGQQFLEQNDTHKRVYVSGLMDGNHDLVSHCAGDTSAETLSTNLTQWLERHPHYLTQPAHHAFTRSVTEMCDN